MLFTQKSEIDIHEMSPLALAFVGDAVLELLVRARLVGTTRSPSRPQSVGVAALYSGPAVGDAHLPRVCPDAESHNRALPRLRPPMVGCTT